MNRFSIFKTKEKKMLDLSTDLFDIRNSSEKLFPSNTELKKKIGKDIFDINLTIEDIEDIYRDNDSPTVVKEINYGETDYSELSDICIYREEPQLVITGDFIPGNESEEE